MGGGRGNISPSCPRSPIRESVPYWALPGRSTLTVGTSTVFFSVPTLTRATLQTFADPPVVDDVRAGADIDVPALANVPFEQTVFAQFVDAAGNYATGTVSESPTRAWSTMSPLTFPITPGPWSNVNTGGGIYVLTCTSDSACIAAGSVWDGTNYQGFALNT